MKKLIYPFLLCLFVSCNYDTVDLSEAVRPWNVVIEGIENNEIISSMDGDYIRVQLEAPGQWSVSISYENEDNDEEWVTVSAASGSGSKDLLLTIAKNTTLKERNATVNFIGDDTKSFRIRQSGDIVSLEATPSSMNLEGGEQNQPVSVIATNNFTWQVSIIDKQTAQPVTWIEASKTTGLGNATDEGRIILNILQNDNGKVREAYLIFRSEEPFEFPDGSSQYIGDTIEITQLYFIPDMPVILYNDNNLYAQWEIPSNTPFPIEKYHVDFFEPDGITILNTIEISPTQDTILLASLAQGTREVAGNGPNDIRNFEIQISAIGTDSELEEVYLGRSKRYLYNTHFASTTDGLNESTAYELTCRRHLQNINSNLNAYYRQEADIDLTGQEWDPIAGKGGTGPSKTRPEFTGFFDGNNYKISNLTIHHVSDATSEATGQHKTTLGLFGKVCGATIQNVTLENVDIQATSEYDETETGALIGYIEFKNLTGAGAGRRTIVTNCHVTGGNISVQATGSTISNTERNAAQSATGGVIGLMDVYNTAICSTAPNAATTDNENPPNNGANFATIIENCSNAASVNASYCTGGILGAIGYTRANTNYRIFCTVTRCYNKGNLTVDGVRQATNAIGGIVGKSLMWASQYLAGNFISECWNSGNIETKTGACVGGIIGRTVAYGVRNCYNKGNLTFTSTLNNTACGGISGFTSSTAAYACDILNCYSTGTISGNGSMPKGLIIGSLNQIYPIVKDNGGLVQGDIPVIGAINAPGTSDNVSGSFTLGNSDLGDRNKFPTSWNFSVDGIWVAGTNGPTLRNNPEQ